MIFIEQDAKRLLMERLDKCLKIHADMLDAQNIGSIYELQGFSELHYYLKPGGAGKKIPMLIAFLSVNFWRKSKRIGNFQKN